MVRHHSPGQRREKMGRTGSAFLVIFFGFAMLLTPAPGICSSENPIPYPDVPRMAQNQCVKLLDKNPRAVLIDVRPLFQYKESLQKLPGAVYENPEQVQTWEHKYKKNQPIIVY
jgi:hypothetical protein